MGLEWGMGTLPIALISMVKVDRGQGVSQDPASESTLRELPARREAWVQGHRNMLMSWNPFHYHR